MMKLCTTHCPKCRILEKKLNDKQLKFEVIEDVEQIRKYGQSVPLLVLEDQTVLDYYNAIKYVNEKK